MGGLSKSTELPNVPTSVVSKELVWLREARKYLGQKEISGGVDNPFITDCFKFTSYPLTPYPHDEVPWCAAFVSRILRQAGQKDMNSAWAFDYKGYGTSCELKTGAVVVFKWSGGGGHVTFCDHVVDGDYVACLGGNQDNMVKISTYARKYIMASRWPTPLITTAKT